MNSIPEGLLEQIERGNVFLFVGERIIRDADGQVVTDQLAFELATRCKANNPALYTFAEAAQVYEEQMSRHALVQFVRDQWEALGDAPQEVHRLIARLTQCKLLGTTCLDRRLERAFEEANRPLDVIIGNEDVPFQNEQTANLYKLRGSVERIESLVLTEDDSETFFDDQKSISRVLQGYLASKTILFVGYDLAAPHFKRLYRKVTDPLDAYARRAYAFGDTPALRVACWCKRHRIEVVEAQPAVFLNALIEQLATHSRPASIGSLPQAEPLASLLPERPYKLLDYYEAGDAAIFFGREQETQTLTSLIHAHRLVLLYGASGTGKTSLSLAGVLPHLEQSEPAYETLYVRALEDPARAIRRAIRRRLPGVTLPQDGALVDFLAAATQALEHPLVIYLDQFEEFFIRRNPQFRQTFISELGELYEAYDVPVKIVFGLREDWLAAVSEIEERIPEVYRTKMRLFPLSRDQARRAITSPVAQLEMSYDPALVEQLLDDLVDDPVDGLMGRERATVMPPQLQLVCDALFEHACADGRQHITMADYEAIGQAQGILSRYIEAELQQYPGDERELAKRILMALVTSQATNAVTDLPSLIADVGAEEEVVEHILSRLTGQRLVRRLDEGQTYELAHDILAASIAGWIDEEDRQLKRARELLRRELADWQQDATVFLSQSKFQHLNVVRDGLQLSGDEAAFLLRAAVLYDDDIPYWLNRIEEPAAQAEILLEMLQNDALQARLAAAKNLAGFAGDDIATALAHTALGDAESVVRDMAAVSLGRMGSATGIKQVVEAAQASEDLQARQAIHALALIQDAAAARLADVAGRIRRQVYYELAKIRFWRSWSRISKVTAVGAIGGAIGFGLGLSSLLTLTEFLLYRDLARTLRDIIFIAPLLATFGLLTGGGMAFGVSLGEALFSERAKMGRIVGGALLGGLAFMVVLSLPIIADAKSLPGALLASVGSGLFGMMIALGITVSLAISSRRIIALVGGVVGGAAGLAILGNPGFIPGQANSIVMLLASGGVVGLIMAFTIAWAEARWPLAENAEPR